MSAISVQSVEHSLSLKLTLLNFFFNLKPINFNKNSPYHESFVENATSHTETKFCNSEDCFLYLLQKHFILAVGEPSVKFLRLLQQPLLLGFIKTIHL